MNYIKRKYQLLFKSCLLICALWCAGITAMAQTATVPSLLKQLQKSRPDTNRVKLLIQAGGQLANRIPAKKTTLDSALLFLAMAEKLSLSLTYPKGRGDSYLLLARVFCMKRDQQKCNYYNRQAIDVYTKAGLIRDAAEGYLKLEEYYQAFNGKDISIRAAFYEQGLSRFQQSGARAREAATLAILGDFYQILGQPAKAIEDLKRSLVLSQSLGIREVQATYDLLGNICSQTGDYKEAIRYGLLAIKTAESLKDTSIQLCTIYNRLGLTYYYVRQFSKSRACFEKALDIARRYKDTNSVIIVAANLSNIYAHYQLVPKTIILLKEIEKHYPPADPISRAQLDALFLTSYVLLKQYETATPYSKRLIRTAGELHKYDSDQEVVQYALTYFFIRTKQYEQALKYLKNFRAISIAYQNTASLAESYYIEFQLDSTRGRYKSAIRKYIRFAVTNDSLLSAEKSKQVAQLEIKYQTEQKDNELKIKEQNIRLLTRQGQLRQISIGQERTTRNMIIGGAILLILLLGLNYNRYRLKQRINRRLQVQQNEISQKNRSLTTLIEEKDELLEEKEWLMKEIHHRVKNNLQIVISLLNTQSIYIKNDAAFNAIRESQHRMQSISLIHQKLYQSENLALVNMPAYINDLVDYLRDSFETGNRIIFETAVAEAEFDVTRAVPLGLILNEAITNSIKYGFPENQNGHIRISMQQTTGNNFALKISDNGTGLSLSENISKSKTLGMSLIRGLSKQINGTFKVSSDDEFTIIVEFTNDNFLKTNA